MKNPVRKALSSGNRPNRKKIIHSSNLIIVCQHWICRSQPAGIALCNNLQNVGATTYKTVLQQPTFLFCNFLQKGLAKNRRNGWKSIDSIDGAITLGYYYSITETAKANGAIPYFYYKYLFEEIPKHLSDPGMEWRADCMAWSEKYKAYEASERMKLPNITFDDFPEDPWIIWKQLQNQDKCA